MIWLWNQHNLSPKLIVGTEVARNCMVWLNVDFGAGNVLPSQEYPKSITITQKLAIEKITKPNLNCAQSVAKMFNIWKLTSELFITWSNRPALNVVWNVKASNIWNNTSKPCMKKYRVLNAVNCTVWPWWKDIFKLNTLPMMRGDSNVNYAEKVLPQINGLKITIMCILGRNPISVNFAPLVLPAEELMLCINEAILGTIAVTPRKISKILCFIFPCFVFIDRL